MEGYNFDAMEDRDGVRFSWHLLYVWLFAIITCLVPVIFYHLTFWLHNSCRPKTKIGATRAVVPIAAMYVHTCWKFDHLRGNLQNNIRVSMFNCHVCV